MIINTTICTHTKTIQRLSRVMRARGRSKKYIISWILRRLAEEDNLFPVSWSRIRYQTRDSKNGWKRTHLMLTPVEYELLLDLKKMYKVSGSRIIGFALERYADELIDERCYEDNYLFTNYAITQIVIEGVTCLIQCWGIPRLFLSKIVPRGSH